MTTQAPTSQMLVEEFDLKMKESLEGWSKRWANFKAEQAVFIQQLMETAMEEAKKGQNGYVCGDPMMKRGDTKKVLESEGFGVNGCCIFWSTAKSNSRAAQLWEITMAMQPLVDIRDMQDAVWEHINEMSPESFRVNTRSKASEDALQEILAKYPMLKKCETYGETRRGYCILALRV